MKHYTLARPYANAAYLYAKEHDTILPWTDFLSALASVFSDQKLLTVLEHPKFNVLDLVGTVMDKAGKKSACFKNFLMLLMEHNRLNVLPDVFEVFMTLAKADASVRKVTIQTAMKLSKSELTSIQKSLQKRFNEAVEMDVIEAPELIGGFIIQSDDYVIDNSLKGQLARLKQNLSF